MDEKKVQNLASHWLKSAKDDINVMNDMFKLGHFVWSLFLGHLILEKVLKARVILATAEEAPKIHNLARLAELAGLELAEEEVSLLEEVTDFNIEARYSETKKKLHEKATKQFTRNYLEKIIVLYQKLCLRTK